MHSVRRFIYLHRPPFVPLQHAPEFRLADQLATLEEIDRVGREIIEANFNKAPGETCPLAVLGRAGGV